MDWRMIGKEDRTMAHASKKDNGKLITTDIYAHVIEQADEKATETLANAILRKHA